MNTHLENKIRNFKKLKEQKVVLQTKHDNIKRES